MLFKKKHLKGIKNGTISLAFRKWEQCRVKTGSRIKTSVGIVEIQSITKVNPGGISESDAEHAGYNSKKELLTILDKRKSGMIFKIGVGYFSEDPRIALREQSHLSAEEVQLISRKLKRLDTYSRTGKWTLELLTVISENPHLKASDLAELTNRDKEWLKRNVRKLKNLGLTISYNPGYSLSPRGDEYLRNIKGK